VALPPLECLHRYSLLVTIFPLGGHITWGGDITLGGTLNLEVKPKLGHHPRSEDNPHSEDIIHSMGRTSSDHWASIGIILFKGIHNHLGGNNLKLALSYPLVRARRIPVLTIPFGARTFNIVSLCKGTSPLHTTL
jgi:hypothetical protein